VTEKWCFLGSVLLKTVANHLALFGRLLNIGNDLLLGLLEVIPLPLKLSDRTVDRSLVLTNDLYENLR
jgi:hypothetical protein